MIDSVFREHKNKFIDYKIEKIKSKLDEYPSFNTSSFRSETNTSFRSGTNTSFRSRTNNENNISTVSTQTTIKSFYKSSKSIANGSGYSAVKFLR
jgi:hypothetical protein